MKNNLKRILSFVLVALMCASVVPFGVFAAETTVVCGYCGSTDITFKEKVDPTCYAHGGDLYECQKCKAGEGTAEGEAADGLFLANVVEDHFDEITDENLELVKAKKDATCFVDGSEAEYKCKVCGLNRGGETIPASHTWEHIDGKTPDAEGWCTIVAPVCGVNGGEYKRNCTVCDLEGALEKTTPVVDHVWDFDNPVSVTDVECKENDEDTSKGKIVVKCKNEGCTVTQDVVVDKCEHKWSKWVKVIDPACGEGTEKKVCAGCGKAETRYPLAHDLGELVPAVTGSCTTAGYKAYKECKACHAKIDPITGEDITNSYKIEIKMPDGTTDSVDDFDHNWVEKVIFDGKCGSVKTTVWGCTNCTATWGEVKETVTHVGTLTHHASTATCTAEGLIEYWSCSACNKNFSDEDGTVAITGDTIPTAPAIKHKNATKVEAKPATCKESGNKEYYVCPDCNKLFMDATCTLPCGEVFVLGPGSSIIAIDSTSGIVLPQKTEHTGVNKTYVWDADASEWVEVDVNSAEFKNSLTCCDTIVSTRCDVCMTEISSEVYFDKLNGHDFSVKSTTPVSVGSCVAGTKNIYEDVCQNGCGETQERAEDPHEDVNNVDTFTYLARVDRPSTCNVKGLATYMCNICMNPEVTKQKELPLDESKHVLERVEAKAATCLADGNIEYWVCTVCDRYFADQARTSEYTDKTAVVTTKLVHNFATLEKRVDPTGCDVYGYEIYSCANGCGTLKGVALSVNGHTEEVHAKKDANCTEDGHYEYAQCTKADCGEYVVVEKKVIPATGHKNAAGQTITDDCTDAANVAIKDRVCVHTNCTDPDKKIELAHNVINISGTASCISAAYTGTACSKCFKILTQNITAPINPDGHNFTGAELVIDTPADCQNDGAGHYVCTLCKTATQDAVVADTPELVKKNENHAIKPVDDPDDDDDTPDPSKWIYVGHFDMTPTSEGYDLYKCKWCDHEEKFNILDPDTIYFSFDYSNANPNANKSNVVNGGMLEIKVFAEALQKEATNIQATFNYDPAVLTFVGAEGQDLFDKVLVTGNNGLLTIYAFNDDASNSEIDGKQLFVTLKFKVAVLDNVLVDNGPKEMDTFITNFDADATVNGETATNLVCDLSRAATNETTITINRLGALNADNWITGLDHVALYNLIATNGVVDGALVAEADIDMDGDVDADDYIFLAQYLANELTYAELVEVSAPKAE